MKNWLDKFQEGGAKSPIYTTDKSKVKAYKDSLNLYNKGEKNFKEYQKLNKKLGIPTSSTRKWNDPVEYTKDIELSKIQPIEGYGYWYTHNPNVVTGTNIPSDLVNNLNFKYKQPTQPYILGREQEQVNYLPFNSMQEQPGQGMYPTSELLRGLQMVPYTRGTVQYPGGYQEKGYELVDKVYKEGGSPKLINVMDGYMPRQDVDNTATPITPKTSGISQKQLNNQLYALRTEGLRKREEEKREIESRRQAENVIDSGKGKFTLPTGETKDYSKMNFREKSYVKGEALKNRGRAFPDENNIIDDLNPLNWIGSMAGNMSQAPYVAQQTDSYIPYVTAIAEPLIMGRAMGSGSINPLGKKFWTNSVSDAEFANSLLMGVPRASVKTLSKLPFENVPILNEASRINPWRFKPNPEAYYRGIGKEGMEDALHSGVFRPKNSTDTKKVFTSDDIKIKFGKSFDKTYYSPDFKIADRYGKGYIAEVPNTSAEFNRRYANKDWSYHTTKQIPIEEGKIFKKNWLEGYSKIKTPNFSANTFKAEAANLIDNLPETKSIINSKEELWQMEELPGLHLKSTMEGSPLEKQLSKSGEININNIKAHINKSDVGQQDKFIINKVLNEKFADKTKINYNNFRKAISEELVPLEKNILPNYEHNNWGLDKLGYPSNPKYLYDARIKNTKKQIDELENLLKNDANIEPTSWYTKDQVKQRLQTQLNESKNEYAKDIAELENLPLENVSITYSNPSKFGRGSADHFDESTLGHARTLVSKEEPDVMHMLEQQSDYWQKLGKQKPIDIEKYKEILAKREASYADDLEVLKNLKEKKVDYNGNPVNDYQIKQFENIVNKKGVELNLRKGDIANSTQKEFLGKNHQERLLQENVAYAVEQGKSKMRYPTSETAAKIQGYIPYSREASISSAKTNLELIKNPEAYKLKHNITKENPSPHFDNQINEYNANPEEYIKKQEDIITKNNILKEKKGDKFYDDTYMTVLKKYDETPKMIKKTLGVDVKTITDSKGNTWYEFDIPKKFKEGKAEIKAFSTIGTAGLGLGAASQLKKETPEYQKGGFVDPEIIEARKKAYRTIKPSSYDDLNNIARWYSNTAREDYDEPRSEDAWAFYLKQKEKSDYLTPSKYKPSISKDPAAKYYNVDPELEQAIFNSFKDKVSLNKIMPVDEFDLNVRYTEEELEGIPHTNVGLKDRNATGSKARMLGRFSVSKGHDEKGDYLSYYDTYDFPEIIQNRVKGEPFNIYGRVYYPNNKKQVGGPIVDLRSQQKYPNQVSDNTQNTQLNFIPKSVEEYNRLNPNQKELEFLQNHPLQKFVPVKTPSSYYEEKEIERKKEIFKQKQYEKEGRNKEGEYKVLRKPRPELDRWLNQVGYPAFEVASLVGGVGEGYQLLKSTGKLGRLGMIKALGRDIFEKPSNVLKNNKIAQGIDNTLTSIGNRANVLSLDPVGAMIDHQVAGLNTAVNVNWLWDINTGKYIPNFNGSVGNVVSKYTSDLYDGIGPDKVTSPLNTIRDLNIVKGTINPKEQFGGPIVDPRGQWKYPGQVTRIPSSNITMQGVNYPVYGVGSNGQEQMMYPGQEYNFPSADYVDEYPMMKDGGLLSKSVTCSNCGWSWKGVEGGLDALTCHKCGGMIKMQNGGLWNKNKTQWVDSVNNANIMKNFVQREYLKNGPSIQVPGEPGRSTHLMAYDPLSKRVYPEVVNINGKLKYLPGDQAYDYADSTGEFITFPTAEQAEWYSNNGYKTGTGVTIGKKESGGQHGGLDRWFAEKWVDVKTGKECGRQEGENRKGYPACRPSKRINADTPKTVSELSSAEKAKFKQEKTSSERINYNHKKQMGGDIPYDTMENFYEMKEGGNVPTNPSLWSRAKSVAKSKYDVYPSAYANGFAAKWYKERGGNWKKAAYGMEVMENGGTNNPGFQALPKVVQAKILSNMGYGGYYNPMMANGGEPDGEMALGQIDAAINKLSKLRQFIQPDSDLEPWVSSKLTMVDDYANSVSDYIMYNPETEEMMELPLEEMKNGGIPERYKNMGFTKVGAKRQSTRPGKKWMVLAKKGDDYKVVHGGYKGMQDFKQHHSEQRRKNFWNRMGGKNSSKATDPFSPLYWHKRFGTWENGGQVNQMQNGGIMMRDLEYPVYGIDRDLFNSRLQNGGNVNWLDNIN